MVTEAASIPVRIGFDLTRHRAISMMHPNNNTALIVWPLGNPKEVGSSVAFGAT